MTKQNSFDKTIISEYLLLEKTHIVKFIETDDKPYDKTDFVFYRNKIKYFTKDIFDAIVKDLECYDARCAKHTSYIKYCLFPTRSIEYIDMKFKPALMYILQHEIGVNVSVLETITQIQNENSKELKNWMNLYFPTPAIEPETAHEIRRWIRRNFISAKYFFSNAEIHSIIKRHFGIGMHAISAHLSALGFKKGNQYNERGWYIQYINADETNKQIE